MKSSYEAHFPLRAFVPQCLRAFRVRDSFGESSFTFLIQRRSVFSPSPGTPGEGWGEGLLVSAA